MVCKKITEDGVYINLVFRLVLAEEYSELKNTIITAVGEGNKRFFRRLRNNQPIYKKE